MNFTILSKELKKGISIAERITGKNLTLPILDNILIEALPNFIKISSTDLEVGIQWWGLCKTEKEGKIAIPARLFNQLVSSLPEDKVNIKEKGTSLIVEAKNFKTQLKGFSADDFPIIPSFMKDVYVEIDGKKLKEGLSSVVDVASPSQIRPEISGVLFVFDKNSAKFVATDSFRLAEKTINFSKGGFKNLFNKDVNFILPQKTVKELINILSDEEKSVRVYVSESQILFETFLTNSEHPEINLISRQIDGEYPSYQEIIPKESKTKVVLSKEEFVKQIKTAGLFGGRTNEVVLKAEEKGKELEIMSQDADLGESHSSIETKIEGDSLKVSFNWKFVLDGLSNIKSSEITFEFQGGEGPAVIRPVGDATYLYVIMPIKI